MSRTITVKGTGRVNVAPDMTVVSMTLKSLDKHYEKSMAQSAEQLARLRVALSEVGFNEEDIKTSGFNVVPQHETVRDENGNYKTVFAGYSCIQNLKLEFDIDTKLLSQVLSAISKSIADPELNISFTVRDKDAVTEALLRAVAKDARTKAEILASASDVKLSTLLSIDYNTDKINLNSRTEYMLEKSYMAMNGAADISVTPEDITVSDIVTFVWEIK